MLRLLLFLVACGPKPVPSVAVASSPTLPLDAALPVDPLVHQGVLANGLHWYVEPNHRPQHRAELRLVIRAGSVLEGDDQRGLAHFLEHMAFNGTTHFPRSALVQYFESVGMQFGAHVNASTSFDETVYTLTVPTDRPELLDQGLLVLADQGGGLTLDPVEIEKERGVVIEEWRTGRGAEGRITDALIPFTFHSSRYADRLPIGLEPTLRTFDAAALRRYYTDWYRPDLMAVIAVGDFDPATVQALIEKHFSGLRNPETTRPRPDFDIPPHETTLVGINADPEFPSVAVSLWAEYDDKEVSTYGHYRQGLVRRLTLAIVNERLADRTQADRTWLGAGAGWNRFTPTEAADVVGATLHPDRILAGMDALVVEVARAKRYGFTDPEFERARRNLIAEFESYYQKRDTAESKDGAAEIVRVFTTGESMPGTEAEHRIATEMITSVLPADLNQYARTWMDGSLVVELAMPKKDGLVVPTEAEISAVLASVATRDIPPPSAVASDAPLVAVLPPPGRIVARSTIAALGVTCWKLENGAEVWIKPTDFDTDEVLFGARSRGGHSLATDEQFFSAKSADNIRGDSGLGTLSPRDISKRLSGIEAGARTSISASTEGLTGEAVPRDLEAMFQLVWLQFTAPRFTPDALAHYKEERAVALVNRLAKPDSLLTDARNLALWNNHLRQRPWTPADLGNIDLATAESFYRERFADASDFRFVIVGNVSPDAVEPLVTRYIGSLPGTASRERAGDSGARRVAGVHETVVRAGIEAKARVDITFHGPFVSDWLSRNRLFALGDILQTRLREELREERGGVYGVTVDTDQWKVPVGAYELQIQFTCDPARVDELKAATFKVIDAIRSTPIDARTVESQKEINRRKRETKSRTNDFWRDSLLTTYIDGEDPLEILNYDARNKTLDAAAVQEAARKYLDLGQYVTVVLLPAG